MKIERNIIVFLFLIHIVGIIGYLSPVHDSFKLLSPLSILAIVAAIIFNQPNKGLKSYITFIILVAAGFLIECVGVATGKIFGNYQYGITLGSKLMEVPPIIGFNWLMLVMASGQIANKLKINIWLKAGIGSIMLVLLDFLIEPIAIQYDFWSWQNNSIPFQNYSSWFIVAYLFLLFYLKNNSKADNKAAQWLYVFQIIFFLTLNIFL